MWLSQTSIELACIQYTYSMYTKLLCGYVYVYTHDFGLGYRTLATLAVAHGSFAARCEPQGMSIGAVCDHDLFGQSMRYRPMMNSLGEQDGNSGTYFLSLYFKGSNIISVPQKECLSCAGSHEPRLQTTVPQYAYGLRQGESRHSCS